MGKVRIEKVGDRIWLSASFADAGPKLSRQIPGANWRETDKVWTYPLNLHTCRDLREVFGDKLEIGSGLMAWAHGAVAHEKRMGELGRAMDAELEAVPAISPILAKATNDRTYQRSGARFVSSGRRVLIADEPALGKTATAMAGLMEAGVWEGSHLVVAPLTSLTATWGRQIKLWTPGEVFVVTETPAKRKATIAAFFASTARTKFLVVNPAMIRVKMQDFCPGCGIWVETKDQDMPVKHYRENGHKVGKRDREIKFPEIINHKWTSAIIDECHEHFGQYRPSNITQTMEGLQRIQPDVRIALTGTPLRGYETKLWGTLRWLEAVRGGYWAWIDTWFQVGENDFGYTEIGALKSNKVEDFYKQIDTFVRRLTKKEAAPDLPEKEFVPVWVPLEGKHEKQYQEMLEQGEIALEGEVVAALGPLSEMTRLKQMSFGVYESGKKARSIRPTGESPKIDWLVQALAERGVTGNQKTEFYPEEELGFKYVIASQFTETVDAVERVLNAKGIKTLKITGAVTGAKRDSAREIFQSKDQEFRVMLINTKAGGVSIDLDTWCDEMFILDETWVADDQTQLEGRIDNRSGRVAPRTFYYIRTEGTVEGAIAEGNLSQDEMQKELLDRRRGVELATRIIRKLKESSRKK